MTGLTGLLAYVIIWWMVLFTVLPWGVRRAENPEPGHEPAAPDKPMLWRKAAITSVIAALLWGLLYAVIDNAWISLRPGPQ